MSLLVVDPCGPAGLIKRCGGAAFQKPPAAYCTPCRSVQGSLSYSRASYLGGVEVDGLSKPRSRKSALSNPQRRNSLECKPQSSGPRLSGPGYSKPHWLVRKGRRKVAPCRAAAAAGAPVNSHEPAPVPKLIASVQAPSWIPNVPKQGVYRDLTFALIGAGFALVVAIFIGQWWTSQNLAMFNYRASDKVNTIPEPGPTGQKESVEWVNMVVGKMWKIYRRSVENWIVGILQPAIDKLAKPDYIDRIEVAELNLDYEPLAFRNVQRITSRRANDLQYHIGLRYTGDARCLLNLHLKASAFGTNIPVGVYDLDIDAELWVKIRLAPIAPYVGTVSLAFVRLPTIKLVLAPFRLVNLFAIPFLSSFLTKLLTIDLPNLYVLPRRINFDIIPQEHSFASHIVEAVRIGPGSTASPPKIATTEGFKGELTVTLCEAQNLPIGGLIGWSNPYCTLAIGEQWVESKKNSETSHPSGHKNPVWNQDFQFLVSNPSRQHVKVYVRDSHLTFSPNIGFCEVPIWKLKDCVPTDVWVPLKREGPFGTRRVAGSVRLLLTYKSFVDDDSEFGADPSDGSHQTIKIYSEGETEDAAMGAAAAAAEDAEGQVQDGRSAGFAEVATSDDETGLETGRAVAEVTRFQTGEASASSLPPSKAKKLHHAEGVAKSPESKNRYAAGDLSETGEEPGSKAATGEDNWAASGEKGWAFLVNEVVSKVRELADRDDEGSGNGKRKKKVVVRALGEKADGEDADGAIWTEVSEKDVGGIGRGGRFWGKTDRGEGESSSDGSGSDGAGGNGRPTVLGSGIGTMKEDGTTDVIPTGSDVRERFDEFFANGGGEMVDEKGRPTRWSAEVREFVEKGGYENGAAAIRAKKQETIWKGTRDFLERWGRESENGNGSGNGASVSGRGKVGVLENGKFVKFFDTGNGHHAGDREGGGVKSMSGENHNNGRGARMRGRANEGRTDDERGEFASGRTAVLERTESKDTGSRVSETSSSNEQSAEATESRIVDKNKSEAAAGQVNPVAIVIVAVAVALLLAWGHVQAIKIATLPFSG